METKKSARADLERKKSYFLEIGLIVSLTLVITLFSWSQKARIAQVADYTADPSAYEELPQVTVQEDKRPQAPQHATRAVISDIMVIRPNDAQIDPTLTFLDLPPDLPVVDINKFREFTGEPEVGGEDIPVLIAETMPTFHGGNIDVFREWCWQNLVYPIRAAENGIAGTISVKFVVEKDGTVSSVEVLRGVDRDLDREAVRVVSSSPRWEPGKNRNIPVRTYIVVPIQFVLE